MIKNLNKQIFVSHFMPKFFLIFNIHNFHIQYVFQNKYNIW